MLCTFTTVDRGRISAHAKYLDNVLIPVLKKVYSIIALVSDTYECSEAFFGWKKN